MIKNAVLKLDDFLKWSRILHFCSLNIRIIQVCAQRNFNYNDIKFTEKE